MTPEELSRARIYDPDFDNPDPEAPMPETPYQRTLRQRIWNGLTWGSASVLLVVLILLVTAD